MLRYRYAHWVRDKTRRIRTTAMADGFDNMHAAETENPLETMADEEILQAAFDQLDDRYKVPLFMVYLDGQTCQETADELELPLGTVLSRIHRARGILRQTINNMTADTNSTSDQENRPQPRLKLGG